MNIVMGLYVIFLTGLALLFIKLNQEKIKKLASIHAIAQQAYASRDQFSMAKALLDIEAETASMADLAKAMR
jgi:hypothetical protein